MRRLLLLAPVLLASTACGLVKSGDEKATDVARAEATTVGKRLDSQRPRTGDEVGYAASAMDGVEVLRVTGTGTHDGKGVELIIRTTGSALESGLDPQTVTVRRCFSLRVSPSVEWGEEARDVDCPDGPPLRFAPPPEPPQVPAEALMEKLPRVPDGGHADEAEVRRVLASLDMDPAITTQVKTEDGRVGILLSPPSDHHSPTDCVLAVVGPGGTDVWMPPRIQRMPGEGGCSVNNALHPLPPPH
ncbi:translation initiation factor IF-2 [Actinospica acidiphila]|uniref:Translation initiation factor IF-2 n=1 Tax=Actinospica acidiphila TaxID=304899 RepID=A0A9X5HGR1_9ACTN|nr:translation initiation factor IF-2 [Actinospica acidiphila]NEC53958.1 translation initiation factor IF-2 [Actinospica acidiphila]